MIDHEWDQVVDFQKAAGQPHRDSPTKLPKEEVDLRVRLLREELEEFEQADTLVKQVDGMIDLLYVTIGTLVQMGVRPGKPFQIVHDNNMTKFPDGKAITREDGKILKPEGYKSPEPEIASELALQTIRGDKVWRSIFESVKVSPEAISKVCAFSLSEDRALFVGTVSDSPKMYLAFTTRTNRALLGLNLAHVAEAIFDRSELVAIGLLKENKETTNS